MFVSDFFVSERHSIEVEGLPSEALTEGNWLMSLHLSLCLCQVPVIGDFE